MNNKIDKEDINEIKRSTYFKLENVIFMVWAVFTAFLIIALGFRWMMPDEPPYLSSMVDIYKYFTLYGICAKTLGHSAFKFIKDIKALRGGTKE